MKAIMISIRKEHSDKIFTGEKKWEGRKTIPAIVSLRNELLPISIYHAGEDDVVFYVYEPKTGGGCGKVVGEFVCDFAQSFNRECACWEKIEEALCVDLNFAHNYFNKKGGYLLRICNPTKYDTPKELSEFRVELKRTPIDEVFEFETRNDGIHLFKRLTRPPQSWCYVEEVGVW